ncbi:MAG: FAD-dependent oxidoreductase [Candidatus Saccharibacteria bacterium]
MALKSYIKPIKLKFKAKSELAKGVYAFDFIPPSKIDWQAGQYASFEIPILHGKTKRKTFTIASAPGESVITFATMIREDQPDIYKNNLLSLKKGSVVKMRGPTGPMYINDLNKNYALLATGIGITPFRSMLKQLVLEGATNTKATLFYASGKNGHLFKEDFNEIKSILKNVRIEYIYKPERITGNLLEEELGNNLKDTIYLLAGPSNMVKGYKRTLQGLKIKRKNIKSNPFLGRVSRVITVHLPKQNDFYG